MGDGGEMMVPGQGVSCDKGQRRRDVLKREATSVLCGTKKPGCEQPGREGCPGRGQSAPSGEPGPQSRVALAAGAPGAGWRLRAETALWGP